MSTKHKYATRLVTFLTRLSVCLFLFLISFSSGRTVQESAKTQDLRKQVRDIYTSQIGIREKGSNSGPAVEQYLHYVNLPKGNPWCAAFVCWVFGQANVDNPRTGWSPDLFPVPKIIWSKAGIWSDEPGTKSQEPRHSRIAYSYPPSQTTDNRQQTTDRRQQTTPKTGDIFGLFFPEINRIAHTGFIDQWDGTWLITVEGNTNVSGGSEGDGVYRKRRPVKSIYQVARYIRQP